MSKPRQRVIEDAEQVHAVENTDEGTLQFSSGDGVKKRIRKPPPTREKSKATRATYESTKELEFRLFHIAKSRSQTKCEFILQILDQACSRHDLDEILRDVFA